MPLHDLNNCSITDQEITGLSSSDNDINTVHLIITADEGYAVNASMFTDYTESTYPGNVGLFQLPCPISDTLGEDVPGNQVKVGINFVDSYSITENTTLYVDIGGDAVLLGARKVKLALIEDSSSRMLNVQWSSPSYNFPDNLTCEGCGQFLGINFEYEYENPYNLQATAESWSFGNNPDLSTTFPVTVIADESPSCFSGEGGDIDVGGVAQDKVYYFSATVYPGVPTKLMRLTFYINPEFQSFYGTNEDAYGVGFALTPTPTEPIPGAVGIHDNTIGILCSELTVPEFEMDGVTPYAGDEVITGSSGQLWTKASRDWWWTENINSTPSDSLSQPNDGSWHGDYTLGIKGRFGLHAESFEGPDCGNPPYCKSINNITSNLSDYTVGYSNRIPSGGIQSDGNGPSVSVRGEYGARFKVELRETDIFNNVGDLIDYSGAIVPGMPTPGEWITIGIKGEYIFDLPSIDAFSSPVNITGASYNNGTTITHTIIPSVNTPNGYIQPEIKVGMLVVGDGIVDGQTVVSVTSPTVFEISAATTLGSHSEEALSLTNASGSREFEMTFTSESGTSYIVPGINNGVLSDLGTGNNFVTTLSQYANTNITIETVMPAAWNFTHTDYTGAPIAVIGGEGADRQGQPTIPVVLNSDSGPGYDSSFEVRITDAGTRFDLNTVYDFDNASFVVNKGGSGSVITFSNLVRQVGEGYTTGEQGETLPIGSPDVAFATITGDISVSMFGRYDDTYVLDLEKVFTNGPGS